MDAESPNLNKSDTSKPFVPDDRQAVILERLNRLVSSSASSFYFDACRMMKVRPSFKATTNIVGHLLRELESSLCAVLETVTSVANTNKECETCGKKEKKLSHAGHLKEMLKALDFPEDHEISKAWVNITDVGLHKYAHRDGLKQPRAVDGVFNSIWDQMEIILMAVLDKYETKYNKVFDLLNELAQKSDPIADDASRIRNNIPNNFVAHDHFFKKISNPKWLSLLREKGFFKEIPATEHDEENKTFRQPPWPAANYLERMAAVDSNTVMEILKEIGEVENSTVKGQLLSIVANLPQNKESEILEKIKSWARSDLQFFQSGLITPATKIINNFIEAKQEDAAFEIAEVFLELMPEQKTKIDPLAKYIARLKPRMRLEEWQYGDFLEKHFKALIDLNPKRALNILCKIFSEFLELEYLDQGENKFNDYCHISRPKIEVSKHGRHNYEDIEDILITAIRDIGLQIISDNPKLVPIIVKDLDDRKWTIFNRISTYLLSKALDPSDSLKELVSDRLTNLTLLDDYQLENEQNQLLSKGFKILGQREKDIIIEWINKADRVTKRLEEIKKEKNISEEEATKTKESWQRKMLWQIKDDLPADLKVRCLELVTKYGEPKDAVFSEYMSYAGPDSDIKAEDLLKMTIEEIVKYLKDWQPKGDSYFGPTKEGLGRELAIAIKTNPKLFEGDAEKFIDLDPTYVRSYIDGFNELIKNDYDLNWSKILDLCLQVVQKDRNIPDRIGHVGDQDPDWGWTRKSIAYLLDHGLNNNSIQFELKEKVWEILELLSGDDNPTQEEETKWQSNDSDFYTLAINTTRGEAMNTIFDYSLWVYRQMSKTAKGKEKMKEGFGVMPEVKAVLENNLKNDKSAAIRSTYGHFFPWILLIDKKWVSDNLELIFPTGKFTDLLYGAAWDAFMLYAPAYDEPFLALKEKYKEAIENIGNADKKKGRFETVDEKLAEHLMLFYIRGKIKLDDDLLKLFWEKADDGLRDTALNFVGRVLKNDKGKTAPEVTERLKTLWEYRIRIAKSAKDKSMFRKEMSAFEWWLDSEVFDDEWSLKQFSESLDISERNRSDYFVLQRLVDLADKYPLESVQILSKLISTNDPYNWTVAGNKNEIVALLSKAIVAGSKAKEEATDIINRLGSKGHADFNDLLKEKVP